MQAQTKNNPSFHPASEDFTDSRPICDYEGSDYQQVFWQQGGREYEDAAEEAALRKLLPKEGKLLLELGAGAGRNTPRYLGYQQIVLLDYSSTQLQQARQALGASSRFIYVAADIYNMPFVNSLFDGATMIRTLHHMADAPQAIQNVRDVLQQNAVFILEYANKQNIKAIVRYLMKQQNWSPFDHAPVEFAKLNFDFHPVAIKEWLCEANFAIERQLSVSFFRTPLLKNKLPAPFLGSLDSLLQWTGELLQLSPSSFIRNRAIGVSDMPLPGSFFRCPICRHAIEDTPPLLVCQGCGRSYPFENGIYNFKSQS